MIKAIIIGLVAAAVLGGGAYALFHKSSPNKASQTTTTQVKAAKPTTTTTPTASTPSTTAPATSSQPNSSSAPSYNY